MIKKTLLASAAMAALVISGTAGPAWAAPVLQFTSGTKTTAGQLAPASAGWSFTTGSQGVSVTALDAFDSTGTGAGGVRLYTAGGTVLASATVTNSDPLEGTLPSQFHSHALTTPVSLAANTMYFIAEDLAAATMGYVDVTGLTTTNGITYDGVVAAQTFGQNPTTDATMGMFTNGIFGPNFDIAAVGAPVPEPEPASFMLLGTGLLVLLGAGLSRHRRAI